LLVGGHVAEGEGLGAAAVVAGPSSSYNLVIFDVCSFDFVVQCTQQGPFLTDPSHHFNALQHMSCSASLCRYILDHNMRGGVCITAHFLFGFKVFLGIRIARNTFGWWGDVVALEMCVYVL